MVDLYSYRLEALAAGVLFPAVRRRNARFDYLSKLPGGLDRGGEPGVYYASCYPVPEFFFAVVEQNLGEFPLVVFVHHVAGGKTLPAHAHIKRCVVVEREPPLRSIELMRGYAQISNYAVQFFYPEVSQHRLHFAEIAPDKRNRKSLQPLPSSLQRLLVLVEAYQATAVQPLCKLKAVTAAPGGEIRVNALRVCERAVHRFFQQH